MHPSIWFIHFVFSFCLIYLNLNVSVHLFTLISWLLSRCCVWNIYVVLFSTSITRLFRAPFFVLLMDVMFPLNWFHRSQNKTQNLPCHFVKKYLINILYWYWVTFRYVRRQNILILRGYFCQHSDQSIHCNAGIRTFEN
jgi:hypothetical protein